MHRSVTLFIIVNSGSQMPEKSTISRKFAFVFWSVRLCLLIKLIKCLKGQKASRITLNVFVIVIVFALVSVFFTVFFVGQVMSPHCFDQMSYSQGCKIASFLRGGSVGK